MTEFPLFTVIIPQKNRAEYLRSTLQSCMAQDYPNFEIIVSDDCSDDNSVEIVQELQKIDSRIKLFAHKQHLGMRDNFEYALSQVQPGYVMALGGDDGLVPGCIWKMFRILKETGRQLLTWAPASFFYHTPDSEGKNILIVPRKKDYNTKIIKSSDFLNTIARTFNYQIDECPMFYIKGIASTEIIDRVKARTEDHCFYYCPTPDGFSGVVLAGEVDDYVYTDEPLSIGGTTIKSQGQNYRRTDKQSRKEAEQFFNDNIRRTMHKDLASQPYSPLQTLMTADYLLTAKDLPGWPGNCYEISFENLLRQSFLLMANNYFENDVLIRELKILRKIAEQHNLKELFDTLKNQMKRRYVASPEVYGHAITHSCRFEGTSMGITNIFEASNAVPFLSHYCNQSIVRYLYTVIINNIKIIIRSRKLVKKEFPRIDD